MGSVRICVEAVASLYRVQDCPADFTYLTIGGGEKAPWRWEIGFAELENATWRVCFAGHNFSPLLAEEAFLLSLDLPHQVRSSEAPIFLFLHRIAADPSTLDYGKSHIVVHAAERAAVRAAVDKVAKRYIDRCDREAVARFREMNRADQRIADEERAERQAEKAASILPWRPPGRQTKEGQARYEAELQAFCDRVLKIRARSTIEVSSRGWAYLLEEHGLKKGDFDAAQTLINDCRKSGMLPLDICVEDSKRSAENLERLDDWSVDDEADAIVSSLASRHRFVHSRQLLGGPAGLRRVLGREDRLEVAVRTSLR